MLTVHLYMGYLDVTVGFEQTELTVVESEQTVRVCANLNNQAEREVVVDLERNHVTTEGKRLVVTVCSCYLKFLIIFIF